MKLVILLAASLGLASCAQTVPVAVTSPTTVSKVQSALNIACPFVKTLNREATNGTLKATQTELTALAAVLSVCPPNPPPTTTVAAGIDIMSAVATLAPLF